MQGSPGSLMEVWLVLRNPGGFGGSAVAMHSLRPVSTCLLVTWWHWLSVRAQSFQVSVLGLCCLTCEIFVSVMSFPESSVGPAE